MEKIAKLIKKIKEEEKHYLYLFECNPPLAGNRYVVVSAVSETTGVAREIGQMLRDMGRTLGQDTSRYDGNGIETFIFAANERGTVTDFSELPGSTVGIFDPLMAMMNAGYDVYIGPLKLDETNVGSLLN